MMGANDVCICFLDSAIIDSRYVDHAKNSLLSLSLWAGLTNVAIRLIEMGADVNHIDGTGAPMLCLAIRRGDDDVGKKLIDCGADIHQRHLKTGLSAYDFAKKSRAPDIKKLIPYLHTEENIVDDANLENVIE